MSSLRAAAARTRSATQVISSARRPITTHRSASSTPVDNAPGWNEDLATASEAFVKADREAATTINEMQQKTVDHARSRRLNPDSDSENEQTHASYARDEVGGPLGNSGVGEFEGVVGNDDLGPEDTQVEPNGRVVSRRTVHEKATHDKGGQANV
ncbi:hypothetical protein J3R82DRAFT_11500 [Butyriboletus roseoflavus]|nr:hypothetical protein J3R82DRAFT_11500 [Butyriboletus roseoflavus]